jgi:CRISPR-associated endonuclease/helicase Cas3
MDAKITFYGHSKDADKSKWQRLQDHLLNTAALTRQIGDDPVVGDFAYLAALIHDIGKYSQAFQKRLEGSKERVDHSTAGAQEVSKLFNQNINQKVMARMIAYCIAGHHGGLPDTGSEIDLAEDDSLMGRLKRSVEPYQNYEAEIEPTMLTLPSHVPIKPIESHLGFSLAFFTRMVYSTLVDADFLETESFMNDGKKPRGEYESIEMLCAMFNQFLERFDHPSDPINQQRTATLKECVIKANQKPGMFTLTVPTGGGKTFSSMAFALNHAQINGLKRIIYVIPYTSIIEQNAAEFEKVLGLENVLEHHSNFDWEGGRHSSDVKGYDDDTNEALGKLRLAAENWDIPIVVTTNVQFFESLFANRSSRCRKLHNLAKSVLIFDEAQMLPREYLRPCLYAVDELVRNYGTTAVFCTATQPAVGKFLPEGRQLEELARNPQGLYDFYRRVRVINAGKLTDDELTVRMNQEQQALCIVNTRKHAKGLFDMIIDEGKFHLSTLMCPAHRRATITTIRGRLDNKQTCRVVSTQIMEAGIDVDFPTGYRAMAGLDSIIQAAGRVNREGKRKMGTMHVFEPDSQFVKRTPAYIQQGAEVARDILRRFDDPVSMEAIQAYFGLLYDLQSDKAFDAKEILGCFEMEGADLIFEFKTAAERFRLIENNTLPVIIPYDEEAKSLLEIVKWTDYPTSYARKLQIYTVNIYEREFQALESKGAIDTYAKTYAVLNNLSLYDAETGLQIPESSGGEAIFFDG